MNQIRNNISNVTELVSTIKKNIEGIFKDVEVVGEITNLTTSASGHWYFSLSDRSALLSAALFKMNAYRNSAIKNLKNGDKVICSGEISVYLKRGSFQLIVKKISLVGKGELKEKLEKLKHNLAGQGLFDDECKKKIPRIPHRVAVITSDTAAALQDFLNIYKRRAFSYEIVLSKSLVQGKDAPDSIRRSLNKIITQHLKGKKENRKELLFDAVVLMRGGGSLEDLWAFNDEALAYDLYNCPIPSISAIGHQIDYSISDYVADLRAETPSAAAEILTEGQKDISEKLSNLSGFLKSSIMDKINTKKINLMDLRPERNLEIIYKKFLRMKDKLAELNILSRRMELVSYEQYLYEIDFKIEKIIRIQKEILKHNQDKINNLGQMLNSMNPSNILKRGYSYLEAHNRVISNVEEFDKLNGNNKIQVSFSNGKRIVKKA